MEGGKRKVNKSLKAWVAFVKKVQREEKLSYKEAIHRAKVRKDKGEKWMKGGDGEMVEEISVSEMPEDEQMGGRRRRRRSMSGGEGEEMDEDIDITLDEESPNGDQMGGRRRRTRRRRRSMRGGRSMRRRRGSRRR